jgi:hypothetical protein
MVLQLTICLQQQTNGRLQRNKSKQISRERAIEYEAKVNICKLGGEVMEVMEVMNWEVMNSCNNGSNEEVIGLQNEHPVMKIAHGVMM